MTHELLHLLGLVAEHERPDRDKYIKVNWEYMQTGAANQFFKTAWEKKVVNQLVENKMPLACP